MAAAAGKKSTTSLSWCMQAFGLEVEELSALATQYCAGGVWIGKWHQEQKEAWMNQVFEVQTWAGEGQQERLCVKLEIWESSGRIDTF